MHIAKSRTAWATLSMVLALTGCAAPGAKRAGVSPPPAEQPSPDFRAPRPRALETIFSALPMPPANSVRSALGTPGPDYWQQQADYAIEATLDPEARTIQARAAIHYINNSPEPLPYVWIHLEQNLFKKGSLGDEITEPGDRFGNRNFDGGFRIEHLGSEGEPLKYEVYDTVARVELPAPIEAKGGELHLDIRWSFKVPEYGSDRMGIQTVEKGTIFEIAQWFPAVCVYDDVYGWNTLPYLGAGEFYTNIGDFDLRITAPRGYTVIATGVLQNPEEVLTPTQIERLAEARKSDKAVPIIREEEVGQDTTHLAGGEDDGPLTWHFFAEDVRTVAWTASDAFIWDAAFLKESGPDGGGDDGTPQGTLVQSVYPKEAIEHWTKSTDMLRFAIEGYNRRWLRYPYPVATNVNGVVGGMEYPMMIFCSERHDERGLYGVTTHEIGHNWFPMTINTDERRHAWMDEGFNTFINYYSNQERYPDAQPGRGDGKAFAHDMSLPDQQPMEMPADQVTRVGMMQYAKTAVMLVLLREQVLGPERFDRAFREYLNAWKFKSPRPWDFFRCMANGAGAELDWFWRAWIYESATLDQAVETVKVVNADKPDEAEARIVFRNNGEMVMPVVYEITWSEGDPETRRIPVEAWFKSNRFESSLGPGTGIGEKKVLKIRIDPAEAMPDTDRANNVWEAPAE